jgi:Nif-specific regulatory protein
MRMGWIVGHGPCSHRPLPMQDALLRHHGNQSQAAQSLGLTLRQFGYRLRKAGVR